MHSSIYDNIILAAFNAAASTFAGFNCAAISSAFKNISQLNTSGNIVFAAVVFPAPFGPAMIYSSGIAWKLGENSA